MCKLFFPSSEPMLMSTSIWVYYMLRWFLLCLVIILFSRWTCPIQGVCVSALESHYNFTLNISAFGMHFWWNIESSLIASWKHPPNIWENFLRDLPSDARISVLCLDYADEVLFNPPTETHCFIIMAHMNVIEALGY